MSNVEFYDVIQRFSTNQLLNISLNFSFEKYIETRLKKNMTSKRYLLEGFKIQIIFVCRDELVNRVQINYV